MQRVRRSLDRLLVGSRRPLVAFAVAALLSVERPARADALADLDKAHSAYVAHKYDDAEARLRALLDAKPSELNDDNVANARMYLAAVLVEQRRKEEADGVFERLLTDKSDYTPDELLVSQDAIYAFYDARTRLREKIREEQQRQAEVKAKELAAREAARLRAQARLSMLESMASEERVVEKNSRWAALLPFGVGQFQNGQNDLGWVLLSGEALLAIGSFVGAAVMIYEQSAAAGALRNNDQATALDYNNKAYGAFVATDAMAGAFALVAVVGAVQAEASFVPERVQVRRRPLPPLSLSPVIGPGGVGLTGRF